MTGEFAGGGHQPHVVLVPSPPPGHSQPCLQLARKLASRGVVVTIVSSDIHIEELKGVSNASWMHPNLRLAGLQDGGRDISSTTFFDVMAKEGRPLESWLGERLESVLEKMLANRSPPGPPRCIISDQFTLNWVQDVTVKLNLECHAFYASPANALCLMLQLERLIGEGRIPVLPAHQAQIWTDIPGLRELDPADIPVVFYHDTPLNRYDFVVRHFLRLPKSSVILVSTFQELEDYALHALRTQVVGSRAVKARNIFTVGPLCVSEETESISIPQADQPAGTVPRAKLDSPCTQWLQTQAVQSVVYVAFGSGRSGLTISQLHELAEGLEASGQPFLWALRPPSVTSSASAADILHAVSDLLPPGFQERTKDRGFIYSGWAPQHDILWHPATGGFITHCGWNSTTESIAAGVPLLTWPMASEQRLIARFLVDIAKLAIELHKDQDADLYKKEQIEGAVKKLFREEEGAHVRGRMKDMCKATKEAATKGHSSNQGNLASYVQELQRLPTLR